MHWLGEALTKERAQLHAYVLMTNHVHLLISPMSGASVPRLVMNVGRRYVQYINRTYRRTGTLWDSRYKSSLVEADRYLLSCMRYIELNPVRAAMVSDPAQYPWSSYRAHALGEVNERVSPHPVYAALEATNRARQDAYRELFQSALDGDAISDIRQALDHNTPLGHSKFVEMIERMTGQRCDVRPRGRPPKNVLRPPMNLNAS